MLPHTLPEKYIGTLSGLEFGVNIHKTGLCLKKFTSAEFVYWTNNIFTKLEVKWDKMTSAQFELFELKQALKLNADLFYHIESQN